MTYFHKENFFVHPAKFLTGIICEALLTTPAISDPHMSMNLTSVSLEPSPSASQIIAKHLASANWLLVFAGAPSFVVDLPIIALFPSPYASSFQNVTNISLAATNGTGGFGN